MNKLKPAGLKITLIFALILFVLISSRGVNKFLDKKNFECPPILSDAEPLIDDRCKKAEDVATNEASQSPLVIKFPEFLTIPKENDALMKDIAWDTFKSYIDSAKNGDVAELSKYSHSLSDECRDRERIEECKALMDSVYLIASPFKKDAFKNIAYDEKQLVLYSDYMFEEGVAPFLTLIYFVRESGNMLKLLSIRFCTGDDTPEIEECIILDKDKRDLDKNGWWDGVESSFRINTN